LYSHYCIKLAWVDKGLIRHAFPTVDLGFEGSLLNGVTRDQDTLIGLSDELPRVLGSGSDGLRGEPLS
jgi:hypothetical protein